MLSFCTAKDSHGQHERKLCMKEDTESLKLKVSFYKIWTNSYLT